jgi:WXG100 family type VII secretion target
MDLFYELSALKNSAKKYKKNIDDINASNKRISKIVQRIMRCDWSGDSQEAFADAVSTWNQGMTATLSDLRNTYNALIQYGINGGGEIRKQFNDIDKG